MPLAPVRPLWENPVVRLYHGDCVNVLRRLPVACVALVFADPPFNQGLRYDLWRDSVSEAEYFRWTKEWMQEVYRVLKPTGSIYVTSGVRHQARLRLILEEVGFHWRDTICWHYTFGPHQCTKWTPSWMPIHYMTKHRKRWTWNPEPLRVPSVRQLIGDPRAHPRGKIPSNVWILDPTHQLEISSGQNIWFHSRLCGTFKERTRHPCQLPEPVVHRPILASSNEGDLVLDPFLGSGTTAAVAQAAGRRCWGIDLSEDYLKSYVIPRLEA